MGSGQDAGVPQMGCDCEICTRARNHRKYRRFAPSIAIMNEAEGHCYFIDASPDLKYQFEMIPGLNIDGRPGDVSLKGIFLTHAHLGHCYGLWHLGKEATDAHDLPVFCTAKMKQFLTENHPFNLLLGRNNIKIVDITMDEDLRIRGFQCIPIEVPHRNEVGDTVGYIIDSQKRMVYIPDVDHWTERIIEIVKRADIALLDGTFYSKEELPRFEEVPHPPMEETTEILKNVATRVIFTHINHTNTVNLDGEERKYVESNGFEIGYDGMTFDI